MGRFVDSIITFRILRILTTPFEETDAFRLGIIDKKGKELRRMQDLNTVEERDSYTLLHRLVFRLKRIIEKVPIENKRLVSYAAALSLIRENYENNVEPIDLESLFLDKLNCTLTEEVKLVESYFYETKTLTFKQFLEDIPANNAGTPGVAGFTPDTLGVPVKAQMKRQKLFKRKEVKYV